MPSAKPSLPQLHRASLDTTDSIVLLFESALRDVPAAEDITLSGGLRIRDIRREGRRRCRVMITPAELPAAYTVTLPGGQTCPLLPDGVLDDLFTDEPLGAVYEGDGITLRLHAPRARSVSAVCFHEPGGEPFEELSLAHDPATGCWSTHTTVLKAGDAYGYRVKGPDAAGDLEGILFPDPYSWTLAKRWSWRRPSLTRVPSREEMMLPRLGHVQVEARGLMIYEAHLRDVSRLNPRLRREERGTYRGATGAGDGRFGAHLRGLGFNAVEWLPLQDYDALEPPYNREAGGIRNTWNPTSRNHWGYMPSNYFAPEARYTLAEMPGDNEWIGADGRQLHDLRALVASLHEQGIAVLVDVVYNHVAQYGENPIRQMDPEYALRINRDGHRIDDSFCGNDLDTRRPMIRRMIVDSLLHWSKVYGIDGFRFDLAGILDDDTLDHIGQALREEHPGVHLIAEPWGRIYDKQRFSVRGWASWNDGFRDGIRGHDPEYDLGALFGREDRGLLRLLNGDLHTDGGHYPMERFTLNYLASHDGHTLADYIRKGLKSKAVSPAVGDEEAPFSSEQEDLWRLGLFTLFVSRGPMMLHQGEEWGRDKTIRSPEVPDEKRGTLDRDSYNKDDATNWLAWREVEESSTLRERIEFASALAVMRRSLPALRLARRSSMEPLMGSGPLQPGFALRAAGHETLVLINYHPRRAARFILPPGRWTAVADLRQVDVRQGITGVLAGGLELGARRGMVLVATDSLGEFPGSGV